MLAVSFLSKRSTGGARDARRALRAKRSGRAVPARSQEPCARPIRRVDLRRLARGSRARRLFPPEELTELSKPPANIHQKSKRPQRKYPRGLQIQTSTSGGAKRAHGAARAARKDSSFRILRCVLLLAATTR